MTSKLRPNISVFFLCISVPLLALANNATSNEVDPQTLYTLSTEGSTTNVSAGQMGKFVVSILPKPQAHVSQDTPLKLEFVGTKNAKPAKQKLAKADAYFTKVPGKSYAEPKFVVPFTVEADEAALEGKLTFFICTEKVCSRQTKTVSLTVNGTP
jgi:hypothetical protein